MLNKKICHEIFIIIIIKYITKRLTQTKYWEILKVLTQNIELINLIPILSYQI